MANDVYTNIDGLPAENIKVIADRLEARAEMEEFAGMRDRYFDLMALGPDARILELGAGTGIVGRAYVRRDGFAGRYVVTDLSRSLIDLGRKKAEQDGLSQLMDFQVVDAITGDGLAERDFDGVILHTLLSHVPDPEGVMRTSLRAARSGGTIAVFDADYASLQIVSGDASLDEEVDKAIKRGAIAQPTIMRRLPQIATELGLQRMEVRSDFLAEIGNSEFFLGLAQAVSNIVVASGGLNKDTAESWLAALNAAIEKDAFFGMCPYFTYLYQAPRRY